eukprot:TRINITY_DN5624_c0_g1_i4.p1 TRINITY_DN5624_c0_g1~~TRINITY_DN5624_c0_g1_i4.p1  ORF type:complete len:245 (+),score=36.49 TRINITY_DN5624_c0_g1_i4:20-754(+)
MPGPRPAPEGHKRREERDAQLAQATQKARQEAQANAQTLKANWLQRGQEIWEGYQNRQLELIQKARTAKENNSVYVPAEAPVLLVVRIKGINAIAPKPKKILRLFRLRQIHNAVFLRNNKATMNMLRVIEPWVTYGVPNRKTIAQLIYKRGFGKVNGQRIPLSSNFVIQQNLGEQGITCTEELINEIETCGENFKRANNFLWPFKLSSPLGGYTGKRGKRFSYLNHGEFGNRDVFINQFVRRMI